MENINQELLNSEAELDETPTQDIETISGEDLMELLNGGAKPNDFHFIFEEPIKYDNEEKSKIVRSEQFIEGQLLGAKFAGMYVTMANFGMDTKIIGDLIVNLQTLEHNLKLQEKVNEGTKFQAQVMKQQQL